MIERNGTPIAELRPAERKTKSFAEIVDLLERHREQHGPVFGDDALEELRTRRMSQPFPDRAVEPDLE